MIRRVVPWTVLPLAVLAGALTSSPWLRVFPAGMIAVPLFGAAILGLLVPVVVVQTVTRSLLLSALIDIVAFVAYALVVVLHDPTGFGDLVDGIHHGPAQLLTFALPLVSPPSLMIAPVALCWLASAFAGEALVRTEYTMLPYAGWLITFAAAYAGSARATLSYADGPRASDTLLGGALLVTFGLLRVAQKWVRDDESGQSTQPDGVLPVRALAVGGAATLVVTLVAATSVHASTSDGLPVAPQRVPSINESRPVTPLAFVSSLRPTSGSGSKVFSVSLDAPSPGYFSIASVDFYDGDNWTFDRTFRPSGGVVPADFDPALRVPAALVTQRYDISSGPLTTAPWMPYLNRPTKVSDAAISVDPGSGMIVPTVPLRSGESYRVRSEAGTRTLGQLTGSHLIATSAPPIDTQLPASTRATLVRVASSFAAETGRPSAPTTAFLQALAQDLRTRYTVSGQVGSPSGSSSATPSRSTSKTPSDATSSSAARAGSTSFADVLASVIGVNRAATPEQFATLYALVARSLGVPARVVTGFRVTPPTGSTSLPSGSYHVSTADAWTWVEIPVRDAGWVVVDPTPSRRASDQQQQSVGAAPTTRASSAVPTQNTLVARTDAGHAVAPKSAVSRKHARHAWPLPWLAGGIVLLLLAGLVVLRARRVLVRRRRRRAPDPRSRLVGAWQESLDLLNGWGLHDVSTLTSTEVAAVAARRFGRTPAQHAANIGYAANVALFSSTITIEPRDAETAWAEHSALRREVRRAVPMRYRLLTALGLYRGGGPSH